MASYIHYGRQHLEGCACYECVELEKANASRASLAREVARKGKPVRPVIRAADVHDVMLEQLEYLIEHAKSGVCGCPVCGRYIRVKAILTGAFSDAVDCRVQNLFGEIPNRVVGEGREGG